MANERIRLLEDVFHEAAELTGEQRSDFLDRACAGDDTLRHELDSLLAAHDSADQFIEKSAIGFFPELANADAEAAGTMVGRRVGAYEITGVIASGGMGTVYEATQEQPHRTVALKLMKHNVDSPAALRRFQYESQVLGRLQHPGIAQVFEAGAHQEGPARIPFFAMEYVQGASTLVAYAATHRLSIAQRLELFARVCDAVHHGHQKGIIHRDLKPSNILCDASGSPKVIDFGVARATDSEAATATLVTDVHSMIGTLQYMSPEQCDGDPHGVDVRADVYALGVVLYELLCGQTPYKVLRHSLTEAVETIKKRLPARPATLVPALRGDLETIILKALEKERESRYQSAADFGQDIRRFLNSQPIEARPPSMVYQIRMFARRNKTVVRAALAVLVMLIASVALSATYAVIAARDRKAAVTARDEADINRAKAEQITRFLQGMLKSIQPEIARGRDVSVLQELLHQASLEVGHQFDTQPEVKAALLHTIGTTFHKIGHLDEADQHLSAALELREQHLGPEHPETLDTLNEFAGLYLDRHDEDAGELCEKNLAICRRVLGPGHAQTIVAMNNCATYLFEEGDFREAEAMLREAQSQLVNGNLSDSPAVLMTMNNLAPVLRALGKGEEAEATYTEALNEIILRFGSDHPQALITRQNIARLKEEQGLLEEGLALRVSNLADMRRVFPDGHHTTVIAINDLAYQLQIRRRWAEAEPLYEECIPAVRRLFGDDDQLTQQSMINYAYLLDDLEKNDEAIEAYETVLGILEGYKGPDDITLAEPLNWYGVLMLDMQRPAEAERLLRRAMDIREANASPDEPYLPMARSNYGLALTDLARYVEAEPYLLSAYKAMQALQGPTHELTRKFARRLAALYQAWGMPEKARQYEDLARE